MAIFIVLSAMVMNFVLSILNNNGLPMNQTKVIIVQLLITAGALIVFLQSKPKIPDKFYLSCASILVFAIIAMIYKENSNFQFLYKLFVIQTFILLGASVKTINIRYLKWFLYFILIVAIFEAIFPTIYQRIVNPFDYYVSTRDWVNRFASRHHLRISHGLYVGVNRSFGSIFGFAGHRVSSIFLEPLSLGYFSVIYSMVICHAYWGKMKKLIPQLIVCFLLALFSDTRSAVLLLVILIPTMYFMKELPKEMFYFFPILFIVLLLIIYKFGFLNRWSEYKFRIGITTNTLIKASIPDLLFGKAHTVYSGDSGILELIDGAGVIGAFLFYITSSGLISGKSMNQPLVFFSMLFLMVASLFGGACFSIKTASLLGFFIGAMSSGAQISETAGQPVQ